MWGGCPGTGPRNTSKSQLAPDGKTQVGTAGSLRWAIPGGDMDPPPYDIEPPVTSGVVHDAHFLRLGVFIRARVLRLSALIGAGAFLRLSAFIRARTRAHACCGTRRTFRARRQRSARVLRHAENISHVQPTVRTRIAARGEHFARAANDPHAYCGTRGTFRTRSQ